MNSELFNTLRYDEEESLKNETIIGKLKIRIDQIKKTIDSHIISLHGE